MREEDKFRKSKEEKKHKNLPVSPQNQKKKNLRSCLFCVLFFFFFPAENKAAKKRQAIHSDLGLIIVNKMYKSRKTEDQKQRKYEQRDIKPAPLKVKEAWGKEAKESPECGGRAYPSQQTLKLGSHHIFGRMNRWEEGGKEEGAACLYGKIGIQDPP